MASSSNPVSGNTLCKFTVFLHHGGHLLPTPTKRQGMWLQYVGGLKYTLNDCNPDEWSLQEITGILKSLGYKGIVTIFYRKPGIRLEEGLVKVFNDAGAMKIAETAMSICFKEVEVYVILGGDKEEGVVLTLETEHVEEVENEDEPENEKDSENESEEDSVEYVRFSDSEDEVDDGCWMKYINVEDLGEECENQQTHLNNQKTYLENLQPQIENQQTEVDLSEGDKIPSDYESSELNSDEEDSDGGKDLRGKKSMYVKYNPSEMCASFKFMLGMEFTSINQFKEAIREWSLLNGWGLRFKKNDKVRCRVVCRNGCEWTCFVSKVGGSMTYRLKTLVDVHTCGRTYMGKMATSKWVADKLADTMKTNKNISLSGVIKHIKKDYCAEVSINKASVARKQAREKLEGGFVEQYAKLWDYCQEVKRTNPGSSMLILVDRQSEDSDPVFSRLYMCLQGVKTGFLIGCRPVIGLDGCFLKSPFGGILLVAVARDPNDQYFPLAIAVVESENKDSWTWFITSLLDDIGRERRWVFISDQQKGLVPALHELLDGFEHRTCVRHVYANMKKRYGGGSVLRDRMLAACKATYYAAWQRRMMELKAVSKDAHEWLMTIDPNSWAKSHFSEFSKCDMIMNNISEAFNGRILEARDLPIISMAEWIREYLMIRFAKNRRLVEKYKGKSKICPKARKRLDKEVLESGKWTAIWAGGYKFEVKFYPAQFEVDLQNKTCACRFWGLTGIPCRHAVAAIYENREDPHDYVDRYYWVDTYEQVYAPIINPINGEQMWQPTGLPSIMPPHCRTRIGRPKKCRRREKDEPPKPNKLRRQNTSIHCSKCGRYGHNKRICQNPVPPDTTIPTMPGRGRGRGSSSGRGRSGSQQVDPGASQAAVPGASQSAVAGASQPVISRHDVGSQPAQPPGLMAAGMSTIATQSATSQAAGSSVRDRGKGKSGSSATEFVSNKVFRPKLPIQKGPGKWKGQACVSTQQLQAAVQFAKEHTQPSQESRVSKED